MNSTVRKYLIDLASKNGSNVISYSELSAACNLGFDVTDPSQAQDLGIMLGAISAYEFDEDRPLLSVIVVHKNTLEVGSGFYRLCEVLEIGEAKKLKKEEFAVAEMSRVFAFWQDPENVKRFKIRKPLLHILDPRARQF